MRPSTLTQSVTAFLFCDLRSSYFFLRYEYRYLIIDGFHNSNFYRRKNRRRISNEQQSLADPTRIRVCEIHVCISTNGSVSGLPIRQPSACLSQSYTLEWRIAQPETRWATWVYPMVPETNDFYFSYRNQRYKCMGYKYMKVKEIQVYQQTGRCDGLGSHRLGSFRRLSLCCILQMRASIPRELMRPGRPDTENEFTFFFLSGQHKLHERLGMR